VRDRLRAGVRSVPSAAWACACIAILSAASWSILTPPFQAPDEPSHFAYVQVLAETGTLPKSTATVYSPEETAVLADLDHTPVRFNQAIGTISTAAQQRRLQRDMDAGLARGSADAGVATSEPPLYYALQTIPYELASGGTLLERLELMRLLSALLAGASALFVFLFLREALPAARWAWTVGGLCTALAPLLGFMSGVVNPDSLLCAISAALFYCLARGFRRGLTRGLGVAIGAAMALGFMTKLNFVGLVPGVLLALALLTRRAARTSRPAAYRSLAVALAIAASPIGAYALVNVLSNHPVLGALSKGASSTGRHSGSPLDELSYIWQFYLPPLPGMTDYFPGLFTTRQVWFDKSVGMYGWLDTYFPSWVYALALIPAGLIALLCGHELVRVRGAVRARAAELVSYGAIALGMLVLFGADSYLESELYRGSFSEPRYLLPLAVLFASVLALAARAGGRRWGPALGALLVLLILGHDVFSQLLVVGRFYG
jgi:4-amino-4-deoxy-L-arabinose transferase-like glycosyltransferase